MLNVPLQLVACSYCQSRQRNEKEDNKRFILFISFIIW